MLGSAVFILGMSIGDAAAYLGITCMIPPNGTQRRISNEAGRCQEVSSSFFASLNLLLFFIEHTHALARVRPFTSEIFFRRRSLFRVHPTRSAPCSFMTSVLPTKTSLRSWRTVSGLADCRAFLSEAPASHHCQRNCETAGRL